MPRREGPPTIRPAPRAPPQAAPGHAHGTGGATGVGHHHHHGGKMGVHGMVMFGSGDKLFMSHIPMFQEPHNVQAIFEVSLDGARPQGFGDKLFTFKPDPFSLEDLLAGRLDQFKGTVFDGNFEAGGRPVARDVIVRVRKIPLAASLSQTTGAARKLEYAAFGTAKEAFLVHPIGKAPDFDQVLKVSLDGVSDADVAKGLRLQLGDRANDVSKRLRAGESVSAKLLPSGKTVKVTVQRELSVLVGPDFVAGPHH